MLNFYTLPTFNIKTRKILNLYKSWHVACFIQAVVRTGESIYLFITLYRVNAFCLNNE